MNAVVHMISLLPPEVIRRLAALRPTRLAAPDLLGQEPYAALDVDEATARVIARWDGDLCGLLNAMTRGELAVRGAPVPVPARPAAPGPGGGGGGPAGAA